MRHLLAIDIPAAFRRGKSVEQFLGRSPANASHIRHIELRPSDGLIEIWVYEVEDIGSEEYLDLYDFPYLEPDGPDGPVATFPDAQATVAYANASLATDAARWVNLGVAQSEYLDYIRAGRPSGWPVGAEQFIQAEPASRAGLIQALGVFPIIMDIRQATAADLDAMWGIFHSVIGAGDALPFSDGFDRETFQSHWFGAQTSYVAVVESDVLGMYKLGANYPDLGAHIASATYVVRPDAQGKGIGRALVQHSLARAQSNGFIAMQFNYVVSTNAAAVELYKKLGFTIAGTLPKAFRHQQLGLIDVFVMHRFLQPQDT